MALAVPPPLCPEGLLLHLTPLLDFFFRQDLFKLSLQPLASLELGTVFLTGFDLVLVVSFSGFFLFLPLDLPCLSLEALDSSEL